MQMIDLDQLSTHMGILNEVQARLLTASQITSMQPTEDLIEGVLSERSLAILYGKFSSGKSFIALDWAMSVAKGLPWQERETKQGSVVYVLAEGVSGMRDRVYAWTNGRTDGDSAWFHPGPVSLLNERQVSMLIATAKDIDAKLVIFDTLNQSLVGGDENSSVHMGQAIASAKAIQNEAGTTILLIHHTGHNGELRGHSSLPAAADHIIRAWTPAENDSNKIVLYSNKVKEGPRFDPIHLRLERVMVPGSRDGSCRVVSA